MKDSSCYNTVFLFRIMSKLIDLMLTVKMLQKKVTKSWRQCPSKYEKNKKITATVQQLTILVTSIVFCGVVVIEVFEETSAVQKLSAKYESSLIYETHIKHFHF